MTSPRKDAAVDTAAPASGPAASESDARAPRRRGPGGCPRSGACGWWRTMGYPWPTDAAGRAAVDSGGCRAHAGAGGPGVHPYRKRDGYRLRDNRWGAELAQYGIAYARVDVRGSGDSDGVMVDEYAPPELNDGVAVIAWLARQAWSNGSVGMRGISWGESTPCRSQRWRPGSSRPSCRWAAATCASPTIAHYIGGALGLTNMQWGLLFRE